MLWEKFEKIIIDKNIKISKEKTVINIKVQKITLLLHIQTNREICFLSKQKIYSLVALY